MRIRMILIAALAALSLAACHKNKGDKTTGGGGGGGDKLFDRLGGMDGISGVVKDFVENNVAKDERINKFFANADLPGLEKKLVEQICEAAGGPCKYSGKKMKEAHAGMQIGEADFGALVEDLTKALDKAGVKDADKQTLLGVLGPMKPDIVTK